MRFIKRIGSLAKHKIAYILVFILMVVMVIFFNILRSDLNLATALVAFSTMILAVVTAFIIQFNIEREKRDRQERKLITIITWGNDIAKCETAMPLTPVSFEELAIVAPKVGKQGVDAILEHRDRIMRINLMLRYQTQDRMGTQIILIAKGLDKQLDSKLEGLAQQTADKLKNHIELGPKFIAKKITDEEYKTHWESLLEVAKALAEEAEALFS